MRDRAARETRSLLMFIAIVAGISATILAAGCSSPKPVEGPRRFQLNGRVVSIDKNQNKAVLEHGDIPGFMGAMTMAYPVKDAHLLDPLSPNDQITADVVVMDDDVWLENIVVVKKADQAEASSPGESHPATAEPNKH